MKKVTVTNEMIINMAYEKTLKANERKAKRNYINDLVKQGIDKEIAKVMADVNFQYGLVQAL